MTFGYKYKLERQQNGWWLVRFPDIPEALTEGETVAEAHRNAANWPAPGLVDTRLSESRLHLELYGT